MSVTIGRAALHHLPYKPECRAGYIPVGEGKPAVVEGENLTLLNGVTVNFGIPCGKGDKSPVATVSAAFVMAILLSAKPENSSNASIAEIPCGIVPVCKTQTLRLVR